MRFRSFLRVFLATICCVHLLSCAGDVTTNIVTEPAASDAAAEGAIEAEEAQSGEPRDDVVWIWLQAHADLDERILLDACGIWEPVGLACGLTDDPDGAEIHVYANDAACVDEDGDGTIVLATAYWTWDVVVESGCIARSWANEPDERWMRVLLAHEIGHVMGLPHVFRNCQHEEVRLHASGQRICGDAVMNPMLNPAADQMTAGDWLNWEMRTPYVGPQFGAGVTCTLVASVPDAP